MSKYELEEGKGLVREKEEAEEEEEIGERVKSALEEAMRAAWRRPEASVMKKKLSKVAKKWWKPQIEEALAVTKYKEELQARAREIRYDEKIKKVWE